jgi:TatD DNase family protein
MNSVDGMKELVEQYPGQFYSMMGLHPCSVKEDYKEVLDVLNKEFFLLL